MKTPFIMGALFIIAASCSKDDDNNSQLNSTDQDFMQKASYSNYAEVGAGQIATTNGSEDSVKMFGGMMSADHSKSQSSLDSLGNSLNVTLPTTPDQEHQEKAAMLQTMTGYTFDTAYINGQVTDHQVTIALFQKELSDGNNKQLKDYVNTYLPKIEMHLQEAQAIQAAIE